MKRALVADLFCGAGGTSTGARRALESRGIPMELVAVNHWPVAIETHSRNHPDARHYCMDIESAKPEEIVPEGYLDLLMASPTCTHHSRARGGKPTSDQQRMDPWQILTWCTKLRVKRLLIENVPEFIEWGPVHMITGTPLKARAGQYFKAWLKALGATGFTRIEYRILRAADYGDATTRLRLFVMASSDGKPIRWPSPTHAKNPTADLFGNTPLPWRGAREIIDWSLQGTSIFDRKRPLAEKTLSRILAGAERFNWPEPFIAVLRNNASASSIDDPLSTITTSGAHHALVERTLTPVILSQHFQRPIRSVDRPLPTIVGRACVYLAEPMIAPYYGSGSGETCSSVSAPVPTITTKSRFGLAEPFIVPVTHSGGPNRANDINLPVPTITTAHGGEYALCQPFIVPQFGERSGQPPRSHAIDDPLPAVTSHGAGALVYPAVESNAGQTSGRLVDIDGKSYLLDIRFRMLQPHELAAAMGFSSEESQYEFVGTKTEITKQIGNAVPVHTATALVGALMSR